MTAPDPRCIIRIVDLVGMVAEQEPTAAVGQYVKHYDPDAHEGRGDLVTTTDLDDALVFDGFAEAWSAWQATSRTHPVRADGRPNRPLTAFTIEVTRVDVERERLAGEARR